MKHSKENCHSWNIILVNEGLQCANCGSVEYSDGTQGPKSWNEVEGYKNGHADKICGRNPLDVAIYSENNEYARGYRAGYYSK